MFQWITMSRFNVYCALALAVVLVPIVEGAPPLNFQNEFVVSSGLPISLAFLADDRMLIVQKGGQIQLADPRTVPVVPSDFMTLSNVDFGGERGLLDIALDPDFESNGYFYVYYSAEAPPRFRVSRFTRSGSPGSFGDTADLGSEMILWEDHEDYDSCCHFGGGLDVGPDGKIYVTMGDEFFVPDPGTVSTVAQDLTRTPGSILRFNTDGTIPADNPFLDVPGARPEIWAYGLRNPFRARWDLPTERFFIGDVGGNVQQIAFEEINLGVAGANYGWPDCEGPAGNPDFPSCNASLTTDPLFAYPHGGLGGSMTAGMVYRGDTFPEEYYGAFFYADYTRRFIRYLTFDASGTVVTGDSEFEPTAGPVIFVGEGPGGELYYTLVNGDIRRIVYLDQAPDPPILDIQPTIGPAPLEVSFTATSHDNEGDLLTHHWYFGDGTETVISAVPSGSPAVVDHTYAVNGLYEARVEVSDGEQSTFSDPVAIAVGFPPQVSIDQPADGLVFRAGDVITYDGSAFDSDGSLSADDFSWFVAFRHNEHIHPAHGPHSGLGGSFEVPSSEHDFHDDTGFEIILTVTDADGLESTESVDLIPDKIDITFDTVPSGLSFSLDGLPTQTPYVFDTLIGFHHQIQATSQCYQGLQYDFVEWSDGGAAGHEIIVPDIDTSRTASFVSSGSCIPELDLVLHLDASVGVTTNVPATGGSAVTGWADQSSFDNDLVVTGGSPTWIADGLNHQPVIRFDGQGDSLGRNLPVGLPVGNADRSVFMVVNYLSKGSGGFAYGNTISNSVFGVIVAEGNGRLGIQGWGNGNDFHSSVAGTNAGWLSQGVVVEAGTFSHTKNGDEIDSAVHTWSTGSGRLRIGAELDDDPAIEMEIAEILVYDRALTAGERQQIEDYFEQKYLPAINQPPTGGPDVVVVPVGGSVDIDILANDQDPEGDHIHGDTVGIVVSPSHGTITSIDLESGVVSYTHDGSASSEDSFSYTVADHDGATSLPTSVLIHVLPAEFPQLGDLVMHLEADVGVITNSVGDVVEWLDLSGQGNHLTAGGDPALGASGPNGQAFVQLDGGGDKLERTVGLNALPSGASDRSIFAVMSYRDSDHAGFSYGSTTEGQGCAGFGNRGFGLVSDSLGQLTIQGWCLEADFHSSTLGTGEGWLVQSALVAGNTLSHYKDGALIDSVHHVFNTDVTSGRILIGAELDGDPFADMDVAAVMVYDRALSSPERLQVESYLQQKYLGTVPGNQPPVAVDDFATTPSGGVVTVDVLSNDVDADGVLASESLMIQRAPLHGTITAIDGLTGDVTYQHGGSASSSDSFTYTVKDEVGAVSNEATVFLTTGPGLPTAAGLVLHLESDLAVSTSSGNLVAGWLDLSGHGNDLVATGDPVLETDGPTGRPYLHLDGVDDLLETIAPPTGFPGGSADRSVFAAVRYRGAGLGGFSYGASSPSCNRVFGLVIDAQGDLAVQGWCHDFSSTVSGSGADWITHSAVLATSTLRHYQDGGLIDETLHVFDTDALGTWIIGAEIDGSPSVDMDVAAVLVYDRALSEAERQQIESYLRDKYVGQPSSAPIAVDDVASVPQGGMVTIGVLDNDVSGGVGDGVGLEATSVVIVSPPSHGSVSVDPLTGYLDYSHNDSITYEDSFTYRVTDVNGEVSNVATVRLDIFELPPVTDGLVVHLSSESGVISGGSAANGWLDLSGSGNHLSAVGQPVLAIDGPSGLRYLSFDGFDDRFERLAGLVELPGGNEDRSVFSVVRYRSDGFGGIAWGSRASAGACSSEGNRVFGLVVDNHGDLGVQGWCLGNDFVSDVAGNGAGWITQAVVHQSSQLSQFKDGLPIDLENHSFNTDADGRLVVGAEIDGSPAVAMDVAAVLIYDRALNLSERTVVEDYLQGRYLGQELVIPPPVAMDDSTALPLGGTALLDVLVNDQASAGLDLISVQLIELPEHGSVAVDPISGQITYAHDGGSTEDDSFSYTVLDGLGQISNVALVTLSIHTPPPVSQGLVLHLESDFGVVSSGASVSTWQDLSGTGNHLTAAGSPTLVGGALNGQDFIYFDGVDDRLERLSGLDGLPGDADDRSVFAVVSYDSAGFGGLAYGTPVGPCATAGNQVFGLVVDPSGRLMVQAWCVDFPSNVVGTGSGWLTHAAIVDQQVLFHYRNSSLIDTRGHTFHTDSDGRLVIGAELDASPHVEMKVAAVLIYDRALSETERQQIEGYLSDKYLGPASSPLPEVGDDHRSVAIGGMVEIDVLANDSSADGVDPSSVQIVTPPAYGSLIDIDPVSGEVEYLHGGGTALQDSFTYTVTDGLGQTSPEATVHLTVVPSTDGLVLHFESSNGVIALGEDVLAWLDLSTSANDLVASGDPKRVAAGLNGLDFVRLDGFVDQLSKQSGLVALPGGNADRTFFIVANYRGDGFGGIAYGSSTCNQVFGLIVDNHGDLGVQGWCGDFLTSIPGNGAGWLTQSAMLTSGVLDHFKDGLLIDTANHTFATDSDGVLVLGAEIDGNPSLPMDVAAVLIYDRALSEMERQEIEDYLQAKYLGGQ